jgi:hypothetical protein
VTNPDGTSASLADAFTYVRRTKSAATEATETTAATNLRGGESTVTADAAQSTDAAASAGSTQYFAEGAVNSFFDTRFTLTNPGSAAASVTLTFTDTKGQTSNHTVVVAAAARETVAARDIAALADRSFATRIEADRLVIAERTMTWQSDSPSAKHDSFGATATGTLWALSEGKAGGADQAATFVLIANTSDRDGEATVTLTLDDGSSVSRTVALHANSRITVATDGPFAVAQGHRFSALVESIGDEPPQIVVERVTYTATEGQPWAAGSNAVATRLQ